MILAAGIYECVSSGWNTLVSLVKKPFPSPRDWQTEWDALPEWCWWCNKKVTHKAARLGWHRVRIAGFSDFHVRKCDGGEPIKNRKHYIWTARICPRCEALWVNEGVLFEVVD